MGDTNGAAAAAAGSGEAMEAKQETSTAATAGGASTISRRTGAHGEERLQVRVLNICTGLDYKAIPRFGEFCSCSCF